MNRESKGATMEENLGVFSVPDLRTRARERFGSGSWIAVARRDVLVHALETGVPPANGDGQGVDLAKAIAAAIQAHLPEPTVNEDRVHEIIKAHLDTRAEADEARVKDAIKAALGKAVTRIVVEDVKTKAVRDMGVQHKCFEALLKAVSANVPVYLVGPAGSGKTHAAESAAKALGLPFYCQSVCQQTTTSYLLGYMDASGKYVRSLYREAYENGGVFLLDEIDAGNPNVIAVLNAGVSNCLAAFPDGMVKRHENFRLIAAANTYGLGADRQYVGRLQLDAASLDRFAFLEWTYDEDLECAIAPDEDWTRYVQACRAAAAVLQIRMVISPRASLYGARLIAAGMDREDVAKTVLFKGLDAATANKLNEKAIELAGK